MKKKINAMKARQNLGQIMNEVALRGDEYVVERAGKPMVAIISMEKYEQLQKNREEAFGALREIQEKMGDQDAEEMEGLIAEAVEWARQ